MWVRDIGKWMHSANDNMVYAKFSECLKTEVLIPIGIPQLRITCRHHCKGQHKNCIVLTIIGLNFFLSITGQSAAREAENQSKFATQVWKASCQNLLQCKNINLFYKWFFRSKMGSFVLFWFICCWCCCHWNLLLLLLLLLPLLLLQSDFHCTDKRPHLSCLCHFFVFQMQGIEGKVSSTDSSNSSNGSYIQVKH